MKTLAGIVGIVVLTCVRTIGQQKRDSGVEQLLTDYQTAWAKGDANGLASLYTQNAIRMRPEGAVVGRQAIQTMFEPSFGAVWK